MNFKTTYILFGTLVGVLLVFGLLQIFKMKPPGEDSKYLFAEFHEKKTGLTDKDVDVVEVVRKKDKPETLRFVKTDRGWEMQQPMKVHVENWQVEGLVRALVDAHKEANVELGSNLGEYGLDAPSTVVTFKKGDEKEWTLNIGKQSPGKESAVYYVTTSERPKDPVAVKLRDLEAIAKPVNEFRSKDLLGVSALNTSYVDARQKKDQLALEKSGDGKWRFQKPPYGDADYEGDPAAPKKDNQKTVTGVKEFIEAVGDVKVQNESDFVAGEASEADLAKYGLEDGKAETCRIEVKRSPGGVLGGDDKKEPVTEILLVGKKAEGKAGDEAKYYARLESERAVAKVPAKNVDAVLKVIEDPSVLRNRDLVELDQTKADAIDIKNTHGLIKLRKPESTWKLYADKFVDRNADDSTVQGILTDLTQKRVVKSFPNPAKEAEYGFDKPTAVVVSLWTDALEKPEKKEEDKKEGEKKDDKAKKEEKKAEPKLKDQKPQVKLTFGNNDKGVVYVRRERGTDKALLAVPDTVLVRLDQAPLAYLDKNLPSFSESAEVAGLTIERNGQAHELDKEKEDWKIKKPTELAGRKAEARQVDLIVRNLRGLYPDKLVQDQPTPADLDKYGLKVPAVKATVKVKDKDNKTEDWVYLFGNETPDKSGVYGKLAKSDLVFQVRKSMLDDLQADFRDLTVLTFDPNKVKALKVAGWKQDTGFTITLEFERKGPNNWSAKSPPDFALDPSQVESFVTGLNNLRAERFVAEKMDPKDQQFQVEITLDGEKAPVTLTLGKLDTKEKGYLAQTNRLPNDVFLIPQSRFVDVVKSPKYFTKKPAAGK